MPVYNAGRFLGPAIDSILGQTFSDFELITINDGSTDGSGKILEAYAKRDKRMRVVHQKNMGIVSTLNKAIDLSKGKYLARQDGDDISFLTRFEQQIAILDAREDVVLVTGSFEVIDEQDEYLYREVIPTNDRDIKRAMYLRNPIGHGSVMFRKSTCLDVGKYSADCGPTEDYELWTRLAEAGKFAGTEGTLFRWRVNTNGITSTKNDLQVTIMKQHIDKLWKKSPPDMLSRADMYKDGMYYYKTFPKYGVSMKEIILADNAQLAIKLMHRGRPLEGIHQLMAVFFTNRSGIHAVLYRLHVIRHSALSVIRSRTRIGRQDPTPSEVS